MRFALAVALLALTLAGCSDAGDDGSPPTSSSTSTSSAPGNATQKEETISVAATGAYPANPAYTPATLQVSTGALVHVTFSNDDQLPITHNWVVDGIPGASSGSVAQGQEVQFDFTAPAEPGTFDYYCSIGDHRQRGMEGTLTVA